MHAGMVIRAIGTLALILVGWQVGSVVGEGGEQPRNTILGIGVGGVAGFALAPYLLGAPYSSLRRLLHRMPMAELLSAIVGLILGLMVAALLAYPVSFLPWSFGHILPAVAAIVFAYLGISLMLARHHDLAHFLQTRLAPSIPESGPPGIEFLVDTSAIIDGRIADISQAGFLYGTLVVPRFVLSELQHIADSADSLRRARGRRGLEMLGRLQKESTTPVRISDADPRDVADVDGKLIKLARSSSSPVITNDFNLNRIAELQGVRVLNINQLANAMKPVVIPGEEMNVHIIQEGKEFNQGVGYLDDGTMIVVENGRRLLHRETEVVVTRVIQTAAGRMIFAQPKSTLQA